MITIESFRSVQDTPDPLRLLCINKIIKGPFYSLKYKLPPVLGHLLAVAFRDYALANRFKESQIIDFFRKFDCEHVPLSQIDFSGLPISWNFLDEFLRRYCNQLVEINISNCKYLHKIDTEKFNSYLKQNPDNEKTLIVGDTFCSVLKDIAPWERVLDNDVKLKKFVMHKVDEFVVDRDEFAICSILSKILTPNMNSSLKYLDLSWCSIGRASALLQMKALEVLILYNCSMNYSEAIPVIVSISKDLRVLDISRQAFEQDDSNLVDEEEPKLLETIVSRLPKLTHLDISGTNLIGGKDRNISVFETRTDRPFEFLGLFHTNRDAAYRSCIPAITIAGEANESQILNACEAYMDRPEQLSKALNDLYNLYKTITPSETFDNVTRALDVVLPILTKHMRDEQVIIFTTAALWCIVKINVTTKNLTDARVRRTITRRLLDVMHYHKENRVILINGGLTLLFLPDIICEHSRVAAISLLMCKDSDARTQGFGTTLLNTLACQVGGDEKIFIGELDAIKIMIDIINSKIQENTCDEILETAWSTLWNITDETPVNCQKFLDNGGLKAFESCMDKFGRNKEVLRNIMGLLGNVAECERLRVNFMKDRYIQRFKFLLSSQIDGIECSYNACGLLAHIISDGAEFWKKHVGNNPPRQSILDEMRAAVSRWPINSRRNINYRSFQPIVKLLETDVAPESQYWALFALANLTRINPSKYCPQLIPFDGLVKLRKLAEPGVTESHVCNLAKITVYQYERFESDGTLSGLEQCDSIDFEVIKNFRAESNAGDGTSEFGELLL